MYNISGLPATACGRFRVVIQFCRLRRTLMVLGGEQIGVFDHVETDVSLDLQDFKIYEKKKQEATVTLT